MKRYEEFNNAFNQNESAEIQAFGMIIGHIEENTGEDLSWWKDRYKAQLKWLNEEVK